jgi:hypothetical protein
MTIGRRRCLDAYRSGHVDSGHSIQVDDPAWSIREVAMLAALLVLKPGVASRYDSKPGVVPDRRLRIDSAPRDSAPESTLRVRG